MKHSRDLIETIGHATRGLGLQWTLATSYALDEEYVNSCFLAEELPLGETLIIAGLGRSLLRGPTTHFQTAVAKATHRVHGKVTLSRGTAGVMLSVGSANWTLGGIGGRNREITSLETNPPPHLVRGAANWLLRRLGHLSHRTPSRWRERLSGLIESSRETSKPASHWIDNDDVPIADQLRRLSRLGTLKRLIVVSPYMSGSALDGLGRIFKVRREKLYAVLPGLAHRKRRILEGMAPWRDRVFELSDTEGRFPHAKIILAEMSSGGLLFYGSANATVSGLLSRAQDRHAMAECGIALALDRRELKGFLSSMPFSPYRDSDLEGTELETETTNAEEGQLVAWYRPQSGEVEIWLANAAQTPNAEPVLHLGRRAFSLMPARVESRFQVHPSDRGEVGARLQTFSQGKITWGPLTGSVEILEQSDSLEPDVASLWGGDQPQPRVPRNPATSSNANATSTVPTLGHAVLDEYERRSLRVCRAIAETLRSDYPDLNLTRRLWKDRPDLGCTLPQSSQDGARLFLGTRLLASAAGAELPKAGRDLFRQIGIEIECLRSQLFSGKYSRLASQLRQWADPVMWQESMRR